MSGAEPPTSGMDPMPPRRPRARGGPIDPGAPPPDEIPDPLRPGRPPGSRPDPTRPGPGRPHPEGLVLVASGREDRWRHVVDVEIGELGDPEAMRGRCGAAIGGVVPGLGPASADCPVCTATTLPA